MSAAYDAYKDYHVKQVKLNDKTFNYFITATVLGGVVVQVFVMLAKVYFWFSIPLIASFIAMLYFFFGGFYLIYKGRKLEKETERLYEIYNEEYYQNLYKPYTKREKVKDDSVEQLGNTIKEVFEQIDRSLDQYEKKL